MKYVVAVRTLCEFTAKRGDLDLRFTPSATALEGLAGQAAVRAMRGPDYQPELSLSGEFGKLLVRGRADGYDAAQNLLEEIKTFRGDLAAMPANRRALHWAQARVYGWLLCRKLGLAEIRLSLVYYETATRTETALVEQHTAESLRLHFEDQCSRFLAWGEQELAHRGERDAALSALRFPHADFRPGQRVLSEAVYKAATAGRCLMAQAPTGIGKTVGTLFPLLKACPAQALDKVFFLSAKSPGHRLALQALRTIGAGARLPGSRPEAKAEEPSSDPANETAAPVLPLRVLELVAREKACEYPGKACHGEACPLASGFYDRLPAARAEAVANGFMDRTALRSIAQSHRVCPYYLGQELVRWSDVIAGDYNYWFDGNAMLHGMTLANQWRVGVLVDEAHNLVERGRAMYSAELAHTRLQALLTTVPRPLRGGLQKLHRQWCDLEDAQREHEDGGAYAVHESVPSSFMGALQQSISEVAEYLIEQPAASAPGPDAPLLRWHFDALRFSRLLESFGEHSLLELSIETAAHSPSPAGQELNAALLDAPSPPDAANSVLRLRNVVPAPFLKPRLTAAHTTTLFSATLSPGHFYADMLGTPENALSIDVPSPFEAGQLRVELVGGVSTRFRHRGGSLRPIAELMARQYAEAPGNYLAFFSSFEYLQQVAALFVSMHPHIPAWSQSRQMDEAGRALFLSRFVPHGRGIGFAVLGGAFGEGIDLPGTRLVGAFIATLGLPPVNAANEQIRLRMETMFGAGYDYAYLYPGLQKVVQAAGRVIRGPADRGVIHLIDDRYLRLEVRALLPSWWPLPKVGAARDAHLRDWMPSIEGSRVARPESRAEPPCPAAPEVSVRPSNRAPSG